MKAKYFLIGFIFSFFLFSQLFAEEVSIQLARRVALNFYFERISLIKNVSYNDLSISDEYTIQQNNEAIYYVFNINSEGFIMIAADDAVFPVLGYWQ